MISKIDLSARNNKNSQRMAPNTYLDMERKGSREVDGKYELFNQKLVFMPHVSENHMCIAGNILTILNNYKWQNNLPFHVFISEMKVTQSSNYFYPDVIFIKEKTVYKDEQKDVLVNPNIIFEVFSVETENFDRTEKFESYKQIKSLKEYILVSQYERYVEHFYKNTKGEWITGKVYKTGELPLFSIPYKLPLKQIYHGMAF
jgi:Uma2 family endonuclease